MNKNIKTKFGIVVKELRQSKGLSQEKLAEIVELHRTYISDIERGEKNVTLLTIVKIAEGLEVNPSEIFIMLETKK
jgi:transcriptional regulator with XRE-family HTH domain